MRGDLGTLYHPPTGYENRKSLSQRTIISGLWAFLNRLSVCPLSPSHNSAASLPNVTRLIGHLLVQYIRCCTTAVLLLYPLPSSHRPLLTAPVLPLEIICRLQIRSGRAYRDTVSVGNSCIYCFFAGYSVCVLRCTCA